jgi:hypothetical protein
MQIVLFLLLAAQTQPAAPHDEKAVVWLFVRSDCPVSNRYAPEIEKLYKEYSAHGVEFRLVYPEAGLTAEAMDKHRKEYRYTIPALLDARHEYVVRADVHVTPEAAVFIRGQLVYSGRIDDWYADIGKAGNEATHHDLEEVLAGIVAGKPVAARRTKAVGCAIENLQ